MVISLQHPQINRNIFEDLFVLEMANNHLGSVKRGMEIIKQFNRVVRYNNVRAAIKFQFRDVDSFIHRDFIGRSDVRYIKKTMDTRISRADITALVDFTRQMALIPMATVFDEPSVDLAWDLGLDMIKLASSDINDWFLIERLAKTKKPVIASTGGSSMKDSDDLVAFFANRAIPLAVNHCVSLYPTQDHELELNQIDFLRERYPSNAIGFSSHEYQDWTASMLIAYAKGARVFERHIDIETEGIPVSPYCSLPRQVDVWFKAFKKAKEMCGNPCTQKRIPPQREIEYLDALVRGIYLRRDLPKGHVLGLDDVYFAIPLQKAQLSCREWFSELELGKAVQRDQPLRLDDLADPYSHAQELQEVIRNRGL
jgi:N-acetylneuraminate synthase